MRNTRRLQPPGSIKMPTTTKCWPTRQLWEGLMLGSSMPVQDNPRSEEYEIRRFSYTNTPLIFLVHRARSLHELSHFLNRQLQLRMLHRGQATNSDRGRSSRFPEDNQGFREPVNSKASCQNSLRQSHRTLRFSKNDRHLSREGSSDASPVSSPSELSAPRFVGLISRCAAALTRLWQECSPVP